MSGTYNPQELPEAEFLARYSVRIAQTERLLTEIVAAGPEDEPRHFVIQGQRGQGKSSLLRKLHLSLRDRAESNAWLVPVLFKEELYGVTGLCRFWEHTAESLADRAGFAGLPSAFEAAWDSPHYEKDCFQVLDAALKAANLRLVLLIDNIGDLLRKLDRREQQRLREILHVSLRIQIVGASTAMLEQHYDHGAPFYQFFREVNLGGLDKGETFTLLRHLGTDEQKQLLEQVIEQTPGRIETLRRLTAGVPRTLVLLFDILLDRDGNAFRDLELLLDRVTPLYKHRMDDLPTQQQAIVHSVALGWDAMSTGEVARATRLPSKQVSAQLKQLERANVIQRDSTSTKNHLYRLEERFFNIWYLMRNGRPGDRRRALWLVRFLESWCTAEELRARAEVHLGQIRDGRLLAEHAWFMTEALRGAGVDAATEDRLVKATREYLPETMRSMLQPSAREAASLAKAALENGNYAEAERLLVSHAEAGNEDFAVALGVLNEMTNRPAKAEHYYRLAADHGNVEAARRLGMLYTSQLEQLDKAKRYLTMAAKRGDVEAMHQLGLLCALKLGDIASAESYFRRAADMGSERAIGALSQLYFWQASNPGESLRLSQLAIEKVVASEAWPPEELSNVLIGHAAILLWNQQFTAAFQTVKTALQHLDFEHSNSPLPICLEILLAADQTAFARKLFEDPAFEQYALKDRFKPIYYALLQQLGKGRGDDAQRIGAELAETTDEVVKSIAASRARYFGGAVAT